MTTHHVTFDPRQTVHITLIGVGGTGSLILTHLVRLDQAIRALGGKGLFVHAIDPDTVSVTNLTRQNFAPADVGRNKAITLVERCNLYAGLSWQASPRLCTSTDFERTQHVVITCVDSGASRLQIRDAMRGHEHRVHYWLDCGNEAHTGQVVLGQLNGNDHTRLPTILDRDPTGMHGDEPDAPSCSAAEALTRQHLFINPEIALRAAQLLGELLLHAQTNTCATFVNLAAQTRAVAVNVRGRQRNALKTLVPLLEYRTAH